MATATDDARATTADGIEWTAGGLGGLAGAFAMGILIAIMNRAVLAAAIPGLYGLAPPPNLPVGVGVHLFHGVVLGLVFAGIASGLDVETPGRRVGLGVGYGVVTWLVLAALVMPVWLGVVGFPNVPPFPNFAPPSLLWHVVYGVVLGGVYTAVADRT